MRMVRQQAAPSHRWGGGDKGRGRGRRPEPLQACFQYSCACIRCIHGAQHRPRGAAHLSPTTPFPNRLILFLQQSSVEWASSLWLHVIQEVDPTFSRTVMVSRCRGARRGGGREGAGLPPAALIGVRPLALAFKPR